MMLHQYWAIGVPVFVAVLWLWLLFRAIRRPGLRHGLLWRVVAFVGLALFCVVIFLGLPDYYNLLSVLAPVLWQRLDERLRGASLEPDPEPDPEPEKRVVGILRSRTPFGNAMYAALETAWKKELPEIRVDLRVPRHSEDVNEQESLLKKAARENPDAIVLMPAANEEKLFGCVHRIMERGIPVVMLDRQISPSRFTEVGMTPPLYIASDFEEGGRVAAAAMIEALGGRGNVAIISGPRDSKVSETRRLTFAGRIIEDSPDLRIVFCRFSAWGRHEGASLMEDLLQRATRAELTINGVFCCNDSLALGALKAIHAHGLEGKITLIGYDGVPEMQQEVLRGRVYATINVNVANQADRTMDYVHKIIDAKEEYFKRNDGESLVKPDVFDLPRAEEWANGAMADLVEAR